MKYDITLDHKIYPNHIWIRTKSEERKLTVLFLLILALVLAALASTLIYWYINNLKYTPQEYCEAYYGPVCNENGELKLQHTPNNNLKENV